MKSEPKIKIKFKKMPEKPNSKNKNRKPLKKGFSFNITDDLKKEIPKIETEKDRNSNIIESNEKKPQIFEVFNDINIEILKFFPF